MWLVRYALQKPYSIGAMIILILVLGISSLKQLPVDILPNVDTPIVNVIWTYGGLNPREMSAKITSFSEIALMNNVDNIKEISSETFNGVGVVKIQFHEKVDISLALSQVTSISQTILRRMPTGTSPPIVVRSSLSSKPILNLVVSSDTAGQSELSDFARLQLRSQVQSIDGIRMSLPYGGAGRQIMIDLKPETLPAYGLSPSEIGNAVAVQNATLPSGTIREGTKEVPITLDASPQNTEAFANLPLAARDGGIVKLRDVADVRDGPSLQTNIARVNGQAAVMVSIIKIGDASTLDIIQQIKERIPNIQKSAPAGMTITPIFDQSVFVQAAVDVISKEIVIVGFLVALIVFMFLGSYKSSLIVLVSIPLSLLVSIIVLYITGHTLNLLSLAGLALAIGILVDNAMVEIENINRLMAEGNKPVEAAIKGAQQVAFPEFVSTLSTCIVFTPIFFLSGTAGYIFEPLAIVVIASLIASYILSRTVVPCLSCLYLRADDKHHALSFKLESSLHQLGDRLAGILPSLIKFRHLVLLAVAICVSIAGYGLTQLPQTYFPRTDAGLMRLYIRAETGLRVEETAAHFADIQQEIRKIIPPSEIKQIVELIGQPEAVNLAWADSLTIGSFDGEMMIELNKNAQNVFEYQNEIRQKLNTAFPKTKFLFLPADITNQTLTGLSPTTVNIRVMGRDREGNAAIANEILSELNQQDNAVDVMRRQVTDLQEYYVSFDRDQALKLGVTINDALQAVLATLGSGGTVSPSFWADPIAGFSYSVQVQTPIQRLQNVDDLLRVPVRTRTGNPVLLGSFATIESRKVPSNVARTTLQPTINIFANAPEEDISNVFGKSQELVNRLQATQKPGNRIEIDGQAASMQETFKNLTVGFLAAVILIAIIMVFNFQSWIMPLVALSTLPVALSGSVLFLSLTGTALSVPTLMGFIMTTGIATANSVLFTSFARDSWMAGQTAYEAAIHTISTRLRPILMTALTMIVGLIPMALAVGQGAEQNAPLARAVIGGLLTGTFATLLIVPLLFVLFFNGKRPPQPLLSTSPQKD
jgi:multidrug efflux pump subunit AcrB